MMWTFPKLALELTPISTQSVQSSQEVSKTERTVMDRKQEMHSVLKSIGLNPTETAEEQQPSTQDQDPEAPDAQLGDAQTNTTTMEGLFFI